jgi:exopolysaccharide biosynthesis WecB/TagA/CpsF family protein
VGTTEASLRGAARRLEAEGVRIAAAISPSPGFDPHSDEATRLIERLGESGARVCFLAMGAPRQEMFAARAAQVLPGTGFASIGAGIDFLSGHQIRAPQIVRSMALEWAWRLSQDPGRLAGRYARCALALPPLAIAAMASRARTRAQRTL